jgi:large conductance mechanosensitive channel
MKHNLREFRKFILRGNVVDLAVAVVIGAAFNAIVQALVKDVVTPLIGAFYKQQSFATANFDIYGSKVLYGDFINAVVSFAIVAAVVFFLIVQPVNKLIALTNRKKQPEDPTTKKCPECLSEIPKAALRCKFCTTKLPADKPAK